MRKKYQRKERVVLEGDWQGGEYLQGGNMGAAFTIAEDGVMAEEDYPYEHKVQAGR